LAVEEAEIELANANEKKATMEAEVAELNAALGVLQATYQEVMDEKEAAEAEAFKCEQKLDLAQRLVNALGSESVRWASSIVDLEANIKVIIGDVLLASAFVSYVGPFNKKFRNEIMNGKFLPFFEANGIPKSEDSNPLTILTTPA
jgi:dynein heavy chain